VQETVRIGWKGDSVNEILIGTEIANPTMGVWELSLGGELFARRASQPSEKNEHDGTRKGIYAWVQREGILGGLRKVQ